MGRKRRLGNNKCLNCKKTGYYIIKWTRNGDVKNSTGNMYTYFRHNDPTLKDCYVHYILKHKAEEICNNSPSSKYLFEVVISLSDCLTKMGKAYSFLQKKFMTYPLKPKQRESVELGLAWYKFRYVNPIAACFEIVSSALEYETSEPKGIKKEDFYDSIKSPLKKNLERLRRLDIDFKQDLEMGALIELFCEYELPIWSERRKRTLEKQSEAAFGSEKYRSVYAGIEPVK
jgi:hypothetical protein